jgi:hypothetical protein
VAHPVEVVDLSSYTWIATKRLSLIINVCCENKLSFLKRKQTNRASVPRPHLSHSIYFLIVCRTFDDVQWNAQGRNKAIVMGQVGIRCRRCSRLATWARARGAVYYSTTLDGLYQAAQNMAKNHLCEHCRLIPADVKNQLLGLRDCKRRAGGGKTYWAEGARVLGVHETRNGLRFRNSKTGMEQAKKDNGAERIAGKKI